MAAPLSEIAVNLHVCSTPSVLHVSLSWSPGWQTGAISEGEISTIPVHEPGDNLYTDYADGMSCDSIPFTHSIFNVISKAKSGKISQAFIVMLHVVIFAKFHL